MHQDLDSASYRTNVTHTYTRSQIDLNTAWENEKVRINSSPHTRRIPLIPLGCLARWGRRKSNNFYLGWVYYYLLSGRLRIVRRWVSSCLIWIEQAVT